MGGKPQRQLSSKEFMDPFNAGQMVGMLVMLTFLEQNKGIPQDALDTIKEAAATNLQAFLDKPAEDIFLMVDNIVKDIEKI